MKLQEFQSSKCSFPVNSPFSTSWSNDDLVAMMTEKGVYVTGGARNFMIFAFRLFFVVGLFSLVGCGDMTRAVFSDKPAGLPAAFGDFNSDEYPDIFVIKYDQMGISILLGAETEPYVQNHDLSCDFTNRVTSVVPGDFNGDALMDVLVTLEDGTDKGFTDLKILWGHGSEKLNCSSELYPSFHGQPLAMDYNQDMIIDLFGEDSHGKRVFWVFDKNGNFSVVPMIKNENENRDFSMLRIPHSHAFLDLNDDSAADLFVTTQHHFEVWLWQKGNKFVFDGKSKIPWPKPKSIAHIGQSLMLDIELKGKIDHILPVCFSVDCSNSTIFVYSSGEWHNLNIVLHDNKQGTWGFVPPSKEMYLEAPTLHGGDFNMDGYPDLLATLQFGNQMKSFLLLNVKCTINCKEFSRTFEVAWDALEPYNNNTILGVFYDFMQDGVLDIIFVHKKGPTLSVSAFKNSLDYDANFVKVMVITGLKDKKQPVIPGPLGRKNRTYGTNLPGPKIAYQTMTQEGSPRAAIAAQLPQSAYFALHFPYTLFGLGRTPNFVDNLLVGVSGYNRTWRQMIPNSQMVVIPRPKDHPEQWTARLFVTPSKLIVQSFIALLATCVFISVIIGILYWKERREDNYEKFHFLH